MFDSICIRRQQRTGLPIDLGFLAEAMLFYRTVHVVCDDEMFSFLIRVCGPDTLFAALEQGFLKLSYLENKLGVSTVDGDQRTERHNLHFVSSKKHEVHSFAEAQFLELTGKRGRSRRLATRYARFVAPSRWEQPEAQAAKDDLLDPKISDAAAQIILEQIAPGFKVPPDGRFRLIEIPDGLRVETNINLIEAQRSYLQRNPNSSFGVATVVIGMFEALADIRFAAGFSSELAVSPETSAIAEIKLAQLLRPRHKSDEDLRLFQESTFSDGRAIREAVNSGHRNFADVLTAVESARKFKEWLAKEPDTADIREQYLREVSRIQWADKLPPKVLRWLLFSGISGALGFFTTPEAGIFVGAGLNAIDSFLVDRLVKGWKPNQFVEGQLRKFVNPQSAPK